MHGITNLKYKNNSRYSQFRERDLKKKDNRYVNRQSNPGRYQVRTATSLAALTKKTYCIGRESNIGYPPCNESLWL